MKNIAVLVQKDADYSHFQPFHPEGVYPELRKLKHIVAGPPNPVYEMVRDLLLDLQLDAPHIETPDWNPLADIIRPGDNVLLKPNLVLHHNHGSSDISAVVTHASVLRPLIDYVLLALGGTGQLTIGDAPHGDAKFDRIIAQNGLLELMRYYESQGLKIPLVDFRKFYYPNGFGLSTCQERPGDPASYVAVDLGERSHLYGVPGLERLYGSDFNRRFIVEQHRDNHHRYLISGTVMNADVILSVPKLKTHKKTGLTANLKNLVGINGDKNYLAHYRIGSPSRGGDEYPDSRNLLVNAPRLLSAFSRDYLLAPNKQSLRYVNCLFSYPVSLCYFLYRKFYGKKLIDSGNWYGNDTCWRMCLDLNHILFFADKTGKICDVPQRRYFCLTDAIIAGEGDGPMAPTPKRCNLLIGGFDPFQTDYVAACLMGFDPEKLSMIREACYDPRFGFRPEELNVLCRIDKKMCKYTDVNFKFMPHVAWRGEIERK